MVVKSGWNFWSDLNDSALCWIIMDGREICLLYLVSATFVLFFGSCFFLNSDVQMSRVKEDLHFGMKMPIKKSFLLKGLLSLTQWTHVSKKLHGLYLKHNSDAFIWGFGIITCGGRSWPRNMWITSLPISTLILLAFPWMLLAEVVSQKSIKPRFCSFRFVLFQMGGDYAIGIRIIVEWTLWSSHFNSRILSWTN